jgi:hypothetical protein
MQAREDTLALLTSDPKEITETAMEHLLSMYNSQEDRESVGETFVTNQRKTILGELSEILHLRGRLQQMGATFSANGELLTYGNPYSPSEFEAMLHLGPMYEEQWSAFFIENYVPFDHGGANSQMWSSLRNLKKALQNEGVVFGRQHQRYSFGDSSTKLRRLCCAYDELRTEWLAMMRSSLPALDDAQLSSLLEKFSSEDESGSEDGIVQGEDGTAFLEKDQSYDITGRPRLLRYRSSGIPQAVGWRFSDDSTSPQRKNEKWRFSDNLKSVPMWVDVEDANVEKTEVTPQTVLMTGHHGLEAASDMQNPIAPAVSPPPAPTDLMLQGSLPEQVSHHDLSNC